MIQKVFGIWDVKSLTFGQPYFMLTVPAAIRAFSDLSNDPQSSINKHPTDYILFEIGSYDGNTGKFTNLDKHSHLGLAAEYIEQKKQTSAERVVANLLEKPMATTAEVNGGAL